MHDTVLLALALPQENADGRFDDLDLPILYTGVGKVNAAMSLTAALHEYGTSATVINLGSAGSHTLQAGVVVCATRFFQHDMDATALGCALGQTPFEETTHLDNGLAIPGLAHAVCYTGDRFITDKHPTLPMQIIDMEAYAIAKVCQRFGAPFVSLKFITDGADGQAASDWNESVSMSATRLHQALQDTLSYLRHQGARDAADKP